MATASPIVYLSGRFVPLEEAKVSPLDRGFTFGDGVYEMIPVFSGRPFRLSAHVKRLKNSLAAIALPLDCNEQTWLSIADELLRLNKVTGDVALYAQVTRGPGERNHLRPAHCAPTVFVMCRPLPQVDFAAGVSAASHADIRWRYCHIKALTLLPNALLRQYAKEKDGSYEAILSRDGFVTEGAASNVFVVNNNRVSTPPTDGKLLPGVTRQLALDLLRDSDYPCLEEPVPEAALATADEIWLSSATMGIVPVIKLDGQPVGDGKPGPVWRVVNDRYQALKTAVAP